MEDYKKNWKPTWQLRQTKVLDADLQPHTDVLLLVPERRVFPKGNRWIHDMVYTSNMATAHQAEGALQNNFHDIAMIWSEGGRQRNIYYRYFVINRTRNTNWTITRNSPILWPQNNPNLIFPDTVFNFAGYKKLWWDLLNVDGKKETHFTKLKFGSIRTMQRNQFSGWLGDWWKDFGVNCTVGRFTKSCNSRKPISRINEVVPCLCIDPPNYHRLI